MSPPDQAGADWGQGASGGAPVPQGRVFQRRTIDHYEVTAPLGEGGMGTVYRAYDTKLQREVALKVLLPGPYMTEEALRRFVDEARITAKVSEHPNLVSIYNAATSREGQVYLAMEMIRGGVTLQSWIDEGQTLANPAPAAELLAQVCDGLQFVHDSGVVHRDLKPANILIDTTGRAVLGDFGVAKAEGQGGSHTLTGTFMGTLAYASPEQATDSKTVTFRSDLYGVGAVLYACLTGRAPHVGPNTISVLLSIIEDDPPPPSELNPNVPPALAAVCEKAIARAPEERYASADELAAALRAAAPAASALTLKPERKRTSERARATPSRRLARQRSGGGSPLPLIVGLGAALALVAGVAWTGRERDPEISPEVAASRAAGARPTPIAPVASATLARPTPAATTTASSPEPRSLASGTTTPSPTTSPSPSPTTAPADVSPPEIAIETSASTREGPRVAFDLAFSEPVTQATLAGKRLPFPTQEPVRAYRGRTMELGAGRHTLEFTATDAAGNVGRTTWTVDVVVRPLDQDLALRLGPKGTVRIEGTIGNGQAPIRARLGDRQVTADDERQFVLTTTTHALRTPKTLRLSDALGRHRVLRLTSKPRLIRDLDAWAKASDVDRLGELHWVGALLGEAFKGPTLVSGRTPQGVVFPLGQYVHVRSQVPLLLIPGGRSGVGLKKSQRKGELKHVRAFSEFDGLKDEALMTVFTSETPQRKISFPPFLLGRYEVRAGEWDRVPAELGQDAPKGARSPNQPQGGVSWTAAKTWLQIAGDGLRLPSEAEWEYAYRAGTTTRYFWGDAARPGYYVGGARADRAQPRAIDDQPRRPNGFGLTDMAGNCAEWCEDDWVEGPRRAKTHRPYKARKPALKRVTRGGSCRRGLPFLRATFRWPAKPSAATPVHGFRVARAIDLSPRRR